MTDHLVDAPGDAQGVLEVVAGAELAVEVLAVPVVPLVERDGDPLLLQRREGLPVAAVGEGLATDGVGDLGDVGLQVVGFPAIEVLAQQVHRAGAVGEHLLAPAAAGADGDQLDLGVHRAHGADELVVADRIALDGDMAELPAAVHLVAHAPPRHPVGLAVAVGGAALAPRAVGWAIAVFDQRGGQLGRAEARVDHHQRLRLQLAAEGDELVDAEVVVLDACPRGVLARRPSVAGADAVAPVVAAHEVAARPAVDGRVELLEQGHGVGPHPLHVVRRHERGRADPHGARAIEEDGEPGVVGAECGLEANGMRLEVAAVHLDGRNGHHPHPIDQGDANGALPSQDNVACVLLSRHDAKPLLLDPVGAVSLRAIGDGDLHRPVADVGALDVHRQRPADLAARPLPRRVARCDQIEELAVLEHLGPDPAVDAPAQVLDELAVDVGRDRAELLAQIDQGRGTLAVALVDELEAHVVEPRLARGLAPAAEEAVGEHLGAAARLELHGHFRPVLRARESGGFCAADGMDIEQRAAARRDRHVLGLDPARQAVDGVGVHRHADLPGHVAPLLGRDGHRALARAARQLPGRGALPRVDMGAPTRGAVLLTILERRVGYQVGRVLAGRHKGGHGDTEPREGQAHRRVLQSGGPVSSRHPLRAPS